MKFALQAMILGLVALAPLCGREPPFQVTMQVVDDEGRPVEGALAKVAYERPPRGASSVRIESASGSTDAAGRVVLQGKTALPGISYGVEKVGHYQVRGPRYHFKEKTWRQWQPWNPTIEVVLKRIKNPVPMYARKVETKVPEFDQPIGFDLVLSDWVAPYGKGQEADFIFLVQREVKSDREYDGSLTVRFAREGDGLLPWENHRPEATGLRMPYQAPEEGYLSEITWRENRGKNTAGDEMVFSSVSKTMNYFIRVRTKHDAQGRLTSAHYGKIHGDIRWFIGTQVSKSGLAFTYYLNPDGTRNVEYDPQRNLLRPAGSRDRAYDLAP